MESNAADKTESSEGRVRHPALPPRPTGPCPPGVPKAALRPAPKRMEKETSVAPNPSWHREGTFLPAVTRLPVP